MEAELIRLTADDYDECLSLMNAVFSEGRTAPLDMARELPKALASREAFIAPHWGIYEEGNLRAVVGYYPYELVVGGRAFRCATIGNIVTHPESRGKGYMRRMMTRATQMLADENVALSRLGGMRLRYNRYGYENAGTLYQFTMTRENALHRVCREAYEGYDFVPMASCKEPIRREALDLYASLPFRVTRDDSNVFERVLRSHFMEPYIIRAADGGLAGYLTESSDGRQVGELVMRGEGERLGALSAWILSRSIGEAGIGLYPWELNDIRAFGEVCEHFSIEFPCMFRVMDWAGLADALIKLKRAGTALPNGEVTIGIEGYGVIALSVYGDVAQCALASAASPDIELNALEATRFLFGPHRADMVKAVPEKLQALLGAWLPLPLSWPAQDNV